MRAWPAALKSLGYLWISIQIVWVQFGIVYEFVERYVKGLAPPEMTLRYVVSMVIVATPGIALLMVAEKLHAKNNRV